MLRLMGAIDDTTPVAWKKNISRRFVPYVICVPSANGGVEVVSCIHDCQLVDDIPSAP